MDKIIWLLGFPWRGIKALGTFILDVIKNLIDWTVTVAYAVVVICFLRKLEELSGQKIDYDEEVVLYWTHAGGKRKIITLKLRKDKDKKPPNGPGGPPPGGSGDRGTEEQSDSEDPPND